MMIMALRMNIKESRYHSYLLRLWRTDNLGEAVWHIMLENPHTGERHSLTGLSDLVAFLRGVVAQRPTGADQDKGGKVRT